MVNQSDHAKTLTKLMAWLFLLFVAYHLGRSHQAKLEQETYRAILRSGSVCTIDATPEDGYCLNHTGQDLLQQKADCWTDGCLYGQGGYIPAPIKN